MSAETKLTVKQDTVLEALKTRPDYWPAHAADLAEQLDWTTVSTQRVLYHLHDAGLIGLDESGYFIKEAK